jgi:pimeloyl-ACP methyl ester carboxylesterase
VLYASSTQPERLVVFVHGFAGRAVRTWNEFAASGQSNDWWRASDMVFVGYQSLREQPGETAAWLRHRLDDFYPLLPQGFLTRSGFAVRAPSDKPYRELFLVGHSLGGVVLRLALLQQAREWTSTVNAEQRESVPSLLEATLRLFSPASAGFQPAGPLALATSLRSWAYALLRAAPAFSALSKESDLLLRTRAETEDLVLRHAPSLDGMRARILWARPENVVEREGYSTDFEAESLIPQRDHVAVCKPHDGYEEPRTFVETGASR